MNGWGTPGWVLVARWVLVAWASLVWGAIITWGLTVPARAQTAPTVPYVLGAVANGGYASASFFCAPGTSVRNVPRGSSGNSTISVCPVSGVGSCPVLTTGVSTECVFFQTNPAYVPPDPCPTVSDAGMQLLEQQAAATAAAASAAGQQVTLAQQLVQWAELGDRTDGFIRAAGVLALGGFGFLVGLRSG